MNTTNNFTPETRADDIRLQAERPQKMPRMIWQN